MNNITIEITIIIIITKITTNTLSEFALKQLPKLKGAQAHSSIRH